MYRKIFRKYRILHADILNFNPKIFISKEHGIPKSILWHKKGREHNPEEITWDQLIARHVHLQEVDAENVLRGDGWFVVFCAFLINVLVLGFFKCLGILLIEIRNDFHTTPADVSLIVCVTYSLNSIAGPLACFMVVKYSPRAVALTGTIMVASGLMLSWFATSTVHMCFTIGVLGGFGSGLTYSPGLILVGYYFSRNRGLPNGVVVSGSPVGGMIMPSVLSFLISYLGCRGALLIIGGLMINTCICAIAFKNPSELHKPVTNFYKTRLSGFDLSSGYYLNPHFQESDETTQSKTTNIRRSYGNSRRHSNFPHSSTIYVPTTSSQSVVETKIQESYGRNPRWKDQEPKMLVKVPKIHFGLKPIFGERQWGPYKRSSKKFINSQNEKIPDEPVTVFCLPETKVHTIARQHTVSRTFSRNLIERKAGKKPVYQRVLALDHSCVVLLTKENRPGHRRKAANRKEHYSKTRKLREVPGKYMKDENDNLQFEADSCPDEKSQSESEEQDANIPEVTKEKMSWCYKYWCKDNKYFSLSAIKVVLRNPLYIILLLANAAPAIGTTNVYLLIPSFAKHLGMSRTVYSGIYLMVSLFDMFGRLLGTYLSDKEIFQPRTVYAAGLLIAGTFSVLMGACLDYVTLVSVCSVFGFATGLHIGILGVLLQEIVGTEMLPAGYAFSMMLNGVLVLIGPYICGYVLSKHPGSYWPMYSLFGIILICGSLLWVIPICKPKSKGISDDSIDDDDELDEDRSVSDESSD